MIATVLCPGARDALKTVPCRISPCGFAFEHIGRARSLARASGSRWPRVILTLLFAALAVGVPIGAAAQDTHLIIITGVSGDPQLATEYHQWAMKVIDAAKKKGVVDANITYLAESTEKDPSHIKGRSTREGVTKAVSDVAARARPNDEVFILLIGHGSFDGRQASFNLPGPDLAAADYAELLKKLAAERVVFVNTASSSGAFLEPLAGPGRTIVTATKTGGERNDPRFGEFFVEALSGDEADRDRNGRVSILEAFDFAKQKVQTAYEKEGHILTEHATMEDGSQGKLAATLFLAPEGARRADIASISDPALRALHEQQDALERQIAELRLKKDSMDPAEYERQLEKMLTDLAIKSREIRDRETKK
jgi:hypothetical protein